MGQTVLITGCSTGIGQATVHALAEQGLQIFAGVRKLADAAQFTQPNVQPCLLDLNDQQSILQAIDQISQQTQGRLDVLINNAAFAQPGAVEDLSACSLREQFETNVFGTLSLTRACLPLLRQGSNAKIIQISSILGLVTLPYRGAYCASKYALESFSHALRLELEQSHIKVVLLRPGPIVTQFRKTANQKFAAHVDSKRSQHQRQYKAISRYFQRAGKGQFFDLQPQRVAQVILRALHARKPKSAYYVGSAARMMAIARFCLPLFLFDKLVKHIVKEELEA